MVMRYLVLVSSILPGFSPPPQIRRSMSTLNLSCESRSKEVARHEEVLVCKQQTSHTDFDHTPSSEAGVVRTTPISRRERERSKVASHETTTTVLDDDDALLTADSFTSSSFIAGAGGAGATPLSKNVF